MTGKKNNIPVSENILPDLNGIWNATPQKRAYLEQPVKQGHTVILPPRTAHLQTAYFLPILHH